MGQWDSIFQKRLTIIVFFFFKRITKFVLFILVFIEKAVPLSRLRLISNRIRVLSRDTARDTAPGRCPGPKEFYIKNSALFIL